MLVELPRTDCPLQWLLNAMNCKALPLRLRLDCARWLLPYFERQKSREG